MKKTFIKLFSCLLVFIAFSSFLNTNAAPIITIGLTLNYDYVGIDGAIDTEVLFDNSTFWTVDFVLSMGGSPILDLYTAVNKTAYQHTYNYTEYHKDTGDTNSIAQGYVIWIDTDGLTIGENITLQGAPSKVMGIVDITTPIDTYSTYNITFSNNNYVYYQFYDVSTGYLINFTEHLGGYSMYLSENFIISEYPKFIVPLVIIAIPITIKFSKSLKK